MDIQDNKSDLRTEKVIEKIIDAKLVDMGRKIESSKKDSWDKLASISTFLSSVIIALVGLIFTNVYNQRQHDQENILRQQQLKVSQVQVVEKFMPHLSADEKSKKIALLAISSLGNDELATKLAETLGGKGSDGALVKMAQSAFKYGLRDKTKKLISKALPDLSDEARSIFELSNGSLLVLSLKKRVYVSSEDGLIPIQELDGRINSIHRTPDGNVMISTNNNVFEYNGLSLKPIDIPLPKNK